jgi:hypothetical protein
MDWMDAVDFRLCLALRWLGFTVLGFENLRESAGICG